MDEFETVVGLEIHIQLNTNSKAFCSCKADSWGDPPNTNICPVCTGIPGTLPVLNRAVVEKAVLLAAALDSRVQPVSYFDRKNYFYPDLPKGYQISQFDQPIGVGGHLDLPMPGGGVRTIRIHKMHIEEDAGKTRNDHGRRLIDFNRSSVPLVEVVTEPDMRSGEEAAQFLTRLRQLLRWLGVAEADMEKGHLRCDVNISIRPAGAEHLNPKTEIKNVNSIEAVREGILREAERQAGEMAAGRKVELLTLDWDEDTGRLRKMRTKETEADYRYFRDPDLLPLVVDEEWKQAILAGLPELPLARRSRFMQEYSLPEYDAEILTGERALSDYFEAAAKAYGGDPKRVSNWVMNDVLRLMNEQGLGAGQLKLTPRHLADLIRLVDAGTINTSTGKSLLEKVQATGRAPGAIVEEEGLGLVSDDSAIRAVVTAVLAESPKEVENYKAGKATLMGWFVGQVMRRMGGKADPNLARRILEELLS